MERVASFLVQGEITENLTDDRCEFEPVTCNKPSNLQHTSSSQHRLVSHTVL